ncbi:type II toxin-antitoxin system antitoxin SocA domain-containing protein [Paenibacillus larvae]
MSIFEIADYFLHRANSIRQSMTLSKLQKLCYYAQAWYLAFYGKPMFMSCYEFWAFPSGCPVNIHLLEKYEEYKNTISPIKKDTSGFQDSIFTNEQLHVLKQVWKKYGRLHEKVLESLIYEEQPWKKARKENEDGSYPGVIQESDMEAYYLRKWVDARKLNQ